MKNIKFLAIAFVVLSMGIVSCSSDDNWNGSIRESDIVGTWQHYEKTVLINEEVIYNRLHVDDTNCELDTAEFKSDNTMLEKFYYQMELEGECLVDIEDSTWRLEENRIYIHPNFETDVFEYLVSRKGPYLKLTFTEIVYEDFLEDFEFNFGPVDHEFVLGEEVTYEVLLLKQ